MSEYMIGCCIKGEDLIVSGADEELLALVGDEFVDGIFGDIAKGFKKVGKAIGGAAKAVGKTAGKVGKAIVKSPISKVVAGGLTFIVPPAGLAASAALVAGGKVVDAIDGAKTVAAAAKQAAKLGKKVNPAAAKKLLAQATFAKKLVAHTAKAAKMGDKDAQRGLAVLAAARKAKSQTKKVPAMRTPAIKMKANGLPSKAVYVVQRGGRIKKWRKGMGKVTGFKITPGGKAQKGTFHA